MRKKLTAQGPKNRKSYTITLPIEWVKQEQLQEKREVDLEVVGKKIIISSQKESTSRVLVDLNTYTDTVMKILQGLYRLGINEMKVMYTIPAQLLKIMQIVEGKLVGCEVIEQGKNFVVIKDITKESSGGFDIVLRRIFLLLLELVKSENLTQAETLDRNLKKLVNYSQRILIKHGHSDYQKTPFYFVLLDRLEKIADEYTWLIQSKDTVNTKLLKKINLGIRKAYDLFYKFNPQDFDHYEFMTYTLKNEVRGKKRLTVSDMHIHNLARQLNTIYGNIFVLKQKN